MKIRPRIPIYAQGGVSGVGRTSDNWYNDVHQHQMQTILNRLQEYGEADDYMQWLNGMQHAHSYIWNSNKNKMNRPEFDQIVQNYQRAYSGDNNYYPYSVPMDPNSTRWQLREGTNDDYNQYGIKSSFNNGVFTYPGKRTSKDSPQWNYNPDGYFSGITDYRRLLGRKGDYTDEQLNNFKSELNKRGYDIYEDTADNGYYKLRRLATPDPQQNPQQQETPQQQKGPQTTVPIGHNDKYGFDWSKINQGLQKTLNNPNLYALGRLVGNLNNNERVYGEALKGIRPNLLQTYRTHRQVVGDEATKQAYYRRATEGQTRAARPFTSDADRQMAYQMEAQRVGNELRAQGDLADNQRIRETSAESAAHADANTERATQVANSNIASINQANALRHNLLAQKHSAQWSSIDNFLQGVEYRKRQQLAEQQALDDQIFALTQQQDLLYDDRIIKSQQRLQQVLDKHKKEDGTTDYNDPEVINAIRDHKKVQYQVTIDSYKKRKEYFNNRNGLITAKSGTKITHKKKDDLLYKSTRDVVEHFRKMSKLSSDALNRKTPKAEKLVSHPKGKAWRFQQGGVAPFTIYKPVALGGETSTQTAVSSSASGSGKSSKDSEGLDLMKQLFKSLEVEGIPSDVNGIYKAMNALMQRKRAFGDELTTDDIAGLYIQQMQRINDIKFNKARFDKAEEIVNSKDAVSEFAIDAYGRVAVQNVKTGEIDYKRWDDIKKNLESNNPIYNPLRNGDLLKLRAYSPNQAFNHELLEVAGNATSMSEIAKFLKAQLPKIEASENTIEGYTKKDSNLIKQGLRLLQDAPNGDYKFSQTDKSNIEQAEKALNYLYNILPNNMRTLLDIHSGGNTKQLIAQMIGAETIDSHKLEFDAVTGKAAKDANGNSKGEGDSKNSAGLAFALGQGPREMIEFNTGSSYAVRVLGIKGVLQTHSKENLGQGATLKDATKSQQGGYLQWNKATFGGSRLNSGAFDHIILNDSTIMGMDLPYVIDLNGNTVPDFQQLKRMEEADQEIRQNNIDSNNYAQINAIYQKHQLAPKYDQNGKLNEHNYKRFAAIQATLDEDSIQNKESILSDEVALAGDVERDLYEQAMKKQNKDYSLGNGIFGLWEDKLYKGTIFVPYDEDLAFAALSSGEPFKQNLPDNAATIQQMQYAPATTKYKSPDVTLSQIVNN